MKSPNLNSGPESVKAGLAATVAELRPRIEAIAPPVDAEFAFQALVTTRILSMGGGFKEPGPEDYRGMRGHPPCVGRYGFRHRADG